MKRKFEGIWIPRDIWLSEKLSLQEKVFLVEINSLDNEDGCYANNEYFSKFFGLSKTRVSEVINSLVEKGCISSSIKVEEGNKRILKTLINFPLKPLTTIPKRVLKNPEEGLKESFKHNNTFNNTSSNPLNNTPSEIEAAAAPPSLPVGFDSKKSEKEAEQLVLITPEQTEEEKEKLAAKEKEEASIRKWNQTYKDAWYKFYRKLTTTEESPNGESPETRMHRGEHTAVKKIQQNLTAVFKGYEDGYQEFVYILENWPKLKDYYRLQVFPTQIHKNLSDIRIYLRDNSKKGLNGVNIDVPYVPDALELYKEAYQHYKGIPPNTNGKGAEHMAGILKHLKDFEPDNTWEMALTGFKYILTKWPEVEKHDDFYKDNFTLSFINGNSSKIIGIINDRIRKQTPVTVDAAAAWLARNGLNN